MNKNIILVVLLGGTTFVFGFFIGASENKSAFDGVNWTDVASLFVTFLVFCLAFFTYHQWLRSKKKEDSYLVAKKYLAAIDQVREVLNELSFHYNHMCPAPGVAVESKDVSFQRIEHVNKVWYDLYQARMSLMNTKNELGFWNVSLTDEFNKKHEVLVKELGSISVITTCLNSKLFHFINGERGNMNDVIREKNMFDERYRLTNDISYKRITMGFEKVFKFK